MRLAEHLMGTAVCIWLMASSTAFALTAPSVPISEGSIPFQDKSLPGSPEATTYYRIVGDVKSQMRPLVVLHGGPGFSSLYLQPTLDILAQNTLRPIIYYDQVGGGNSTHYPEKKLDYELWTMELFESQLESVLSHFDIANDYDLYGHSWGAMMAAHFAAQRPKGLKHLILASGLASTTAARESFDMLISTLPEDKQKALRSSPKDSDEYAAALDLFYQNFICRLDPWPSALAETFARLEEDDTVYQTMWGSDELDITGSLKSMYTKAQRLVNAHSLKLRSIRHVRSVQANQRPDSYH